jgi:uncharacterized protein (TIGR02466 family)
MGNLRMTNRSIELLFPTPVTLINTGKFKLIEKTKKLIIDSLNEENYKDLKKIGSVTTNDNLNTLEDFQEVVTLVDTEMINFFNNYLGLKKEDTKMTCMWSNIHSNNGIHHIHQHPNSFYSGVLYINVPNHKGNESSKLVFIDPRPAKNMFYANYEKEHCLSNRSIKFIPEAGQLILFPSWLEHGTETSFLTDNEYRISLSFNYILRKSDHFTMKI